MAWTQFKLGRPGYEYKFPVDAPPEAMDISQGPLKVMHTNLAGDLKKSVLKIGIPIIRLNSSYLIKADRDKLATLADMSDAFLSFICRDDWGVYLERSYPLNVNQAKLKNSSATRLSAALIALSLPSIITITGVFNRPDGLGTNYFTGGSYADATRIISLGTPLLDATQPCYTTYIYTGWLVNMESLGHRVQGGWVDRFQYDFELVGA